MVEPPAATTARHAAKYCNNVHPVRALHLLFKPLIWRCFYLLVRSSWSSTCRGGPLQYHRSQFSSYGVHWLHGSNEFCVKSHVCSFSSHLFFCSRCVECLFVHQTGVSCLHVIRCAVRHGAGCSASDGEGRATSGRHRSAAAALHLRLAECPQCRAGYSVRAASGGHSAPGGWLGQKDTGVFPRLQMIIATDAATCLTSPQSSSHRFGRVSAHE